MSNLAYDQEPEDGDFYDQQRERAARKERFNSLEGGGTDSDYSPADDDSDNVVSLDEFRKKKEASASELREQESSFGGEANTTEESKEEEGQLFKEDDDNKSGVRSKVRSGLAAINKRRGMSLAVGVGGVGSILGFILVLVMLGSLKVPHFGQVVSTAGFIRLNSIMEERTTQILFDNGATVGDGELSLRGRSVLDKVKFRNLDAQVTELGQKNKLKFVLDDGRLQGVTLPEKGKTITLDGITKELGFGDKFADLSKGWSKLNPQEYRRIAAVRNEFVKQSRAGIAEGLASESRAVRGRTNKIIADNIGFKFSRWRQKAREYAGLKPAEAAVKNTVELADEVSGRNTIETGVTDLDNAQKELKSQTRLEEYLKKTGGEFDKEKFLQDLKIGEAKGSTIKNVATKVGIGVMIGSIACMANQAMSRVDEVAATNEQQAEKQASLQIAAKDQQLQGEANDEAIGAEASALNGAEQSQWYQYTQYGEVRNTSEVNTSRITPQYGNIANVIQTLTSPSRIVGGPILSYGLPDSWLDGIDTGFCNALLSEEGMIVGVAAEIGVVAATSFFTGGGAAAVEQGGGRVLLTTLVRELASASLTTAKGLVRPSGLAVLGGIGLYQLGLEFAVQQLSGTGFMGAEQGAARMENNGVGVSLLQSRRLRAAGGAPMSNAEATEVDRPYMKQKKETMNEGVFARYLSIENPFSAVGSLSASVSFTSQSPGAMAGSALSRGASSLASGGLFKPLLNPVLNASPKVQALDYNPYSDVVQWGFTRAELDLMRNDPSYSALRNLDFISDQRISELDSEYGDCFNPELLQVEVEKLEQCSAEELRKDDEMFRYRLTKLDNEILGRLSQTPEEMRQATSAGAGEEPTPGQTGGDGAGGTVTVGATDSSTCAAGTRDLGIAETYVGGQLAPSRICAIPGFKSTSSESQAGNAYSVAGANGDTIVSAKSSSNFLNLYTAMAAAKIAPLANSSYRTMAHQQQLCRDNAKCNSGNYEDVAKPGTSNHQGGNAIDFANCSTRGTICYLWLADNAAKYGIKNYPKEPWHWSITGN